MTDRPPALRPTQPATLLVAALAAAAAAWLLISNLYQQIPPMIWPPVILIAGIAMAETALAQQLWARIHNRGWAARSRPAGAGRPEPLEPLVVVRYALLAKASSVAGAILAGAYAGFLPWLAIESTRLTGAGSDLPPAIGGLVASAALVAAAWWLERACRVPEPDERDRPGRGHPEATGERGDRPGEESGAGD
jgi:hypothetical protein